VEQSGGTLGGHVPHGIRRKSRLIRQFVVQWQHLPQQGILRVASFHPGEIAKWGKYGEDAAGADRRWLEAWRQSEPLAKIDRITHRSSEGLMPIGARGWTGADRVLGSR
jgi:hypothetical protein